MSESWIEGWLGAPRFRRYLSTCNGDRERALKLYAWNLDLGLAMMRDIAALEVALRNAYDSAISANWDGARHWLIDYESPFLQTNMVVQRGNLLDQSYLVRRDILQAVDRVGGVQAEPGKIIAELSFAFWTRLTETRYEKQFWVPYLHRAFPEGTNRAVLHNRLRNIRLLRNRIAHHEPIFDLTGSSKSLEVTRLHPSLLDVLHSLSPDVHSFVQRTSTVSQLINQRP